MFATGLIVFRETLEAALFIGIMAAATRMLPRRALWIGLGVAAGVAGSVLVAISIGAINDMASGAGQDWLTVIVLGLALLMLTWHVVWASQHGRELAQKAKSLGQSVAQGNKTLVAVAIAIAMIVLREGSETVLFVSGSLSVAQVPTASAVVEPVTKMVNETGGELATTLDLTQPSNQTQQNLPQSLDLTQSNSQPQPQTQVQPIAVLTEPPPNSEPTVRTSVKDVATGGSVGLGLGILVGVLMYLGLSKIPVSKMFAWTNGLVILLAAGMAGQMGDKLVQMGVIRVGGDTLWDSSRWLPNDSAVGVFLNALMGYDARPSVTQVMFFVLALLVVFGLIRMSAKKGAMIEKHV